MPSARRIRFLVLATVVAVVFLLFYTSGVDSGDGSFYDKTMKAMHYPKGQSVINTRTGAKAGHVPADSDGDGDIDEDDKRAKEQLMDSLGAAAKDARDKANKKAPVKPDSPSKVIGVGSSREGQDKKKPASGGDVDSKPKPASEKQDAKVVLAGILKKAPGNYEAKSAVSDKPELLMLMIVVIFSKTFCPYSKRAKGILLEKYNIEPKPYVVELDEHDLGSEIQDELEKTTGRRTVPNIMINGVSLGGSDQIVELDEHDLLSSKIQEMGKRKVQVSKLLEVQVEKGAAPH